MFGKILLGVGVLGLCAAGMLQAKNQTITGRMSGNLPNLRVDGLNWSTNGADYYVYIDIYPEMEVMSDPGALPGYWAVWEGCYGTNTTSGPWNCVRVEGFLPTRSSAITNAAGGSYAVNIDISMLTDASVTATCTGSLCSPTQPLPPSSWPLIGTFTPVPTGTPGSSRMTLTGQMQIIYYGDPGYSYSTSVNGSMLQTEGVFVGTVGTVPPMTAVPAVEAGPGNANFAFYKGNLTITETSSQE